MQQADSVPGDKPLSFSRRGFVHLALLGTGAGLASMAAPCAALAAPTANDASDKGLTSLRTVVLSDIHLLSSSLYSECEDFIHAANSDRKMFRESGAILDKALEDAVAFGAQLILVPGDLTKDGERLCHEEVAQRFEAALSRLQKKGIEAQVLVINGNHDVNNSYAMDFSVGSAQPTTHTSPQDFVDIYAELTYQNPATPITRYSTELGQGGGLSYVTRVCKGLTVIAVDSCKYSADQTHAADDEHETGGMVGESLLAWVCEQAKKARKAGDVVIAMQHHGIAPHYSMEPRVMGEYLVDDYQRIASAYADAGISCVLTGHMHANDVMSLTSAAGNTIYDIETCATSTYPSETRQGTVELSRSGATLNVDLLLPCHSLGAVGFTDAETGAGIADITAYGRKHLLTRDVVTTVGESMGASMLLGKIAEAGGTKEAIASLMGIPADGLAGKLLGLAATILPTSKEERIDTLMKHKLPGKLKAWFDTKESVVRLATDEQGQNGLSFVIGPKGIDGLIDRVCAVFDENLKTPEGRSLVGDLISRLLGALADSKVDATHALLDLASTAYALHTYGNEAPEAWFVAAAQALAEKDPEAHGALLNVHDGSPHSMHAGVMRAAGSSTTDGSLIALLTAAITSVWPAFVDERLVGSALYKKLGDVATNITDIIATERGVPTEGNSDTTMQFALIMLSGAMTTGVSIAEDPMNPTIVELIKELAGMGMSFDIVKALKGLPTLLLTMPLPASDGAKTTVADKLKPVAIFAQGFIESLSTDNGFAEDREPALKASATDPDYKEPSTPKDDDTKGDDTKGDDTTNGGVVAPISGKDDHSPKDPGNGTQGKGGRSGDKRLLPGTGDESPLGLTIAAGIGALALAVRKKLDGHVVE